MSNNKRIFRALWRLLFVKQIPEHINTWNHDKLGFETSEKLIKMGLVEEVIISIPTRCVRLTPKGIEYVKENGIDKLNDMP